MRALNIFAATALAAMLASCTRDGAPGQAFCDVSLIVLGVAQDGGKPQLGQSGDPAWDDPARRKHATSMALVDRRGGETRRWLFEATPDIREQLHRLDRAAPASDGIGLEGVFLTHAHVGHYAGLVFFGHESAGAQWLRVYAMPRMAQYLASNGPWSQLVRRENVILAIMTAGEAETLAESLTATPLPVPHRQEYSEVVAFRIEGPSRRALFLPDIDSFEAWDKEGVKIEDEIARVDFAYLDATFFAEGEIPGRDMSGFPHPFVARSMERFATLPAGERGKIRFIHMNHTNPLLDTASRERAAVKKAGFEVAEEGEEICL